MKPTFQGEIQLLGWSESHNSGAKVTFQLADPDDLEPFKLMTVAKGKQAGQRLMCVLVEIGEDEQPKPVQAEEKPKGGPLSRDAAMICNTPEFQAYAGFKGYSQKAEGAANLIHTYCRIASRAELDHSARAAAKFSELMGRFREWKASAR